MIKNNELKKIINILQKKDSLFPGSLKKTQAEKASKKLQ